MWQAPGPRKKNDLRIKKMKKALISSQKPRPGPFKSICGRILKRKIDRVHSRLILQTAAGRGL